MDSDHNPFSGLIQQNQQVIDLNQKLNELIESVFLFTINKNIHSDSKQFVYMEEFASQADGSTFDMDLLEQALFERLLLPNLSEYLVPKGVALSENETSYVAETQVIVYLCRAFIELEKRRAMNEDASLLDVFEQIKKLILRNSSTSMNQPSLYEGQSLHSQWLELLQDDNDVDYKQAFLEGTAKEMYTDDELASMGSLKAIFYPMFNEVQKTLTKSNLISLPKWVYTLLTYFVRNKTVPQLGEIIIDYSTPNPNTNGRAYMETLFGQLLTMSILPKNDNGPYDYFGSLSENSTNVDHLNSCLTNHQNNIFSIFKMLLVLGPQVKNKTLNWIANCLHANAQRSQIWTMHNMAPMPNSGASDAFMFGLCSVLLRLCAPLCKPTLKVLLVDPTYCATPESKCSAKEVRLKKAWDETCLLPVEDGEERITAETYNFVTELFFMTHKAIELSYRVGYEKSIRITRENQNMLAAYQDAMNQLNTGAADTIMRMVTSQTQKFLSMKNYLQNPENDKHLLGFCEATAIWLLQVNAKSKEQFDALASTKCFAPKDQVSVMLPLAAYVPPYLKSIPETILENTVVYFNFNRRFFSSTERPHSFFKMVLAFMGSAQRVKNPHLRAKLAEGLESLLPKENENRSAADLFTSHPDRLQIIPNLLEVFVSIEMTGQSVQFEQKFNYRRPMYAIMEFLWTLEEQRQCFKDLAIEAEKNMEATEPPLFLRFINLLINDAIFLLDESLSNMQQIRQQQAAQEKGEWEALPANEREQNVSNLELLRMLAKIYNTVGRDTINILKLITTEIKVIFSHKSMVDRIASMLNYFLLNLVGPNKGKFKVKDKNELKFDPAHTVMEICRIYINLSDCDSFCLAVSQDGRSYSSSLFEYAETVLIRICGGQLIGEMEEFAIKVKNIEQKYKADQEALTNVPDEYLDPIMSSIMTDPVILPSSKVTVDRSTIARHILSDQTDPFNRSPLTMDQVMPNLELKAEIEKWIEQKRIEYSERQKEDDED
ncbi:ubiquitin conjugation factor E4 A [Eupeodes corollae]|uniref:ubiquitin conjugation factor E4 A n=1 Tax=Eupeodes corollae TaxID=290404 RepID=UPI00248F5F75|nr:ubiquitin conjugation factor E4 A [Eupeodes corollae]